MPAMVSKTAPPKSNYQRRIEQATTATGDNDRYTTTCTLEIIPTKDDTVTEIDMIHPNL